MTPTTVTLTPPVASTRPATAIFDILYGGPASGKSESVARLIEHVYRQTGKTARVCVGDGSAMSYHALMDAGVVELCEYNMLDWPRTVLHNLAKGAWPVQGRWVFPNQSDPVTGWTNDLSNVGVWVCEGLTVAGDYLMGHARGGLADQAAHGQKVGQDSPIRFVDGVLDPKTGKLMEGPGTATGGNSPAHYGVAQRRRAEAANDSKLLPVDYVIWTAHEGSNDPEKDMNRELVVAPGMPGRAMTGQIQKLFGNTLHLVSVPKRVKTQDSHTGKTTDELDLEYRLYTRDHFSATGSVTTRFKACTRSANDNDVPQFFVADSPGTALLQYYQTLARLRQESAARIRASVTR